MPRVVLDVNVLISALVSRGICQRIVGSLGEGKFTMALSPTLLEDLLRALEKPRLKRLITPPIFEETIALIHEKAFIVEPQIKVKACRDPDDDAVIECALAAKANIIVTGDQDLLTMNPFRAISILPPRTFATRFKIR